MIPQVFTFLLVWSLSATLCYGLATVFERLFQKKMGNLKASVWNITVLLIWLIPLSPLLIQPFLSLPVLQVPVKAAYSFFSPFLNDELLGGGDPSNLSMVSSNETRAIHHKGGTSLSELILFQLKYGIVGIWLLGVIYCFFRWLMAWYYFTALLRKTKQLKDEEILHEIERFRQLLFLDTKIDVRQGPFRIAPFVKGIWRPVLFLPSGLLRRRFRKDLKAVIAHEMAHIARMDLAFHYAIRMLRIFLWFLPPIWWLQEELMKEQDAASDEYATALLGSGLDFGEALTNFAEYFQSIEPANPAVAFSNPGHTLLYRLDNVLNVPMTQLARIPVFYKILFFFYMVVIFGLAGVVQTVLFFPSVFDPIPASLAANPAEGTQIPTAPDRSFWITKQMEWHTGYSQLLSVAMGDLNGDGFPDLVAGTDQSEMDGIFMNQAGRSFSAPIEIGSKRSHTPSILIDDFDFDQKNDVLLGHSLRPHQILLNQDGRFDQIQSFGESNSLTHQLAAVDMNGDGYPDVVELKKNQYPTVYLNDGHSQFLSSLALDAGQGNPPTPGYDAMLALPAGPGQRAALFISQASDAYIFQMDAAGAFTKTAVKIEGFSSYCFPVRTGGRPDDRQAMGLGGARNEGAVLDFSLDRWSPRTEPIRLFGSVVSCDFGDIDLDGDLDVLVGYRDVVDNLYMNDGEGGFSRNYPVGEAAKTTLLAKFVDFDGDGDLDILRAEQSGKIVVYANQLPVKVKQVSPAQNGIQGLPHSPIEITLSHAVSHVPNTGIIVHGNMGGTYKGSIQQQDAFTLRMTPEHPFFPGEFVEVSVTNELVNSDAQVAFEPFVFQFQVQSQPAGGQFSSTIYEAAYDQLYNVFEAQLADLDGDRDLDLLLYSESQGLLLFLNQGGGRLAPKTAISGPRNRIKVTTLADIDNDGNLDLLVGNYDEMPNRVYRNQGNAVFEHAEDLQGEFAECQSLPVGDLDGDGFLDVFSAGSKPVGQTTYLYLNQQGSFRQVEPLSLFNERIGALLFRDLDKSGKLGILVNYSHNSQMAYYSNFDRSFLAKEKRDLIRDAPTYLLTGDLDLDQETDVVGVVNCEVSPQKYHYMYSLDAERRGKEEPQMFLDLVPFDRILGGGVDDCWLGDIDGDGDLDYLESTTTMNIEHQLLFYENSGQGEWIPGICLRKGFKDIRFAVGDLNGDGKMDIVMAERHGRLEVLLHE